MNRTDQRRIGIQPVTIENRCLTNMTACALPILLATVLLLGANSAQATDDALSTRAVHLLKTKCVSCHGADQVESGLRLDSRAAMFKGGERGSAIAKENPHESLLLKCVLGLSGEELRMPPKNPLSPTEIEVLKSWLAEGAAWCEPDLTNMRSDSDAEPLGDAWSDPRNPIVKAFNGERLGLWSLKPITPSDLPDRSTSVLSVAWCKNEIDRFTTASFETAQVALPPQADLHTLLRRIHFDLTGLPPSVEWISSLTRASAPTPRLPTTASSPEDAEVLENLIDKLLATEQFGIHWARIWLDVARYSDSNGFDWDEFRPQAYRYRDYVIRSLNEDKPYDQFIVEQLAGDELFDGPPQNREQQDALLATGFLRMGPHDNAAKLFNEQDRSRDELLIDLVESTSAAMLGITMTCCRCHDHKFDPISQADYFRMRACFAGVSFADDLPIDLAEVQSQAEQHNSTVDTKIAALRSESDQVLQKIQQRVNAAKTDEKQETLKLEEFKKLADENELQKLDELTTAIKQAEQEKHKLTHAMLMVDQDKPPATFVLYQGDYKTPRQQVEPGILSILDPNELAPVPVARTNSSGRRLALAQWIASTRNPLTARVMVNRVWLQLMGQGLVRTPGDFGLAGAAPADPQLLDWLASRFMNEGWSIKRLIRTIMLSATYQQAAVYLEPPESLQHAMRCPRRLTGEQLRDSMLAVADLLTPKSSGPAEWPELPREVLEANPAFLDDNETKTKGWYPSPAAEQHCRSLFLVQKRNTRVPLLEILDQPENSVPCQRRLASIVAPQALSLLNSPVAIQAAKSFADRVESEATAPHDQINLAFKLALQRLPSVTEQAACEQLLQQASLQEVCRALLNLNEFAYLD